MKTRVYIVACTFIVFVVLLWVSYLWKEKATGSSYIPPTGTEKYGLVGIEDAYDGVIYTSNYLSAWAPDWKRAPDDGTLRLCTSVLQLKNKKFVNVGWYGTQLSTSSKLTNNSEDWTLLPGGGKSREILELHDGTFAAIGSDKYIYTSPILTNDNNSWKSLEGGGKSIRLIQLHDGTFVALGGDWKMYKSTKLTNDNAFWKLIDGTDGWNDIRQLRDGTFIAIDDNSNICTSPILSGKKSNWTVLPDKTIRARSLFIYY